MPPLAGFMSKWQIFVAGFPDPKWLDHRADDLHGAQQCAFAGILRAACQHDVSQEALPTGVCGKPVTWTIALPLIVMAGSGHRAWLSSRAS